MTIVIISAAFALILSFVLGTMLGFFKDFFAVPENPLTGKIRAALPGANCGACGYPGCESYAKAIADGKAGISDCTVGGAALVKELAAITGLDAEEPVQPITAVLVCRGSNTLAPQKGLYTGLATCRGAKIAAGGTKLCVWGCLGFGDCEKVCAFGAITLDRENALPVIDPEKCTGCKKCIAECPQSLLVAIPKAQKGAMILCSNRKPGKQGLLKTCKAVCTRCGLCAKNCPQNCIETGDGIPVVDLSKCDSCGTCAQKCPTKAITIRLLAK